MKFIIYIFILEVILFSCKSSSSGDTPDPVRKEQASKVTESTGEPQGEMTLATVSPPVSTGNIERLDPKLEKIIPDDARLEIIAEGFVWSEGPVWLSEQEALIFSDIPRNSIYKWTEQAGLTLYLEPSGYTGPPVNIKEPGSNGLLINLAGQLVLCQHGNRQMAILNAPLEKPVPEFTTLVDNYKGKRLNSPNDAVFSSRGDLYFTDPPYGLPEQANDPGKELEFQGVYKLSPSGDITLLTNKLTRPNGIALSPDEKQLYVANSDTDNPVWMVYELNDKGLIESERVFFDASELLKSASGLPDGMKIDRKGNIFASGPGGILVFSPEGEHLGTLKTGQVASNCAFNEDESRLYITADMYLIRILLKRNH